MSVKLMSEVWASDISSPWQQILLALADRADDDGTSLNPSVDYLAWKTGKKRRQLIALLSALKDAKVLIVLTPSTQHRSPQYKLDLSALAKKIPWEMVREELKASRKARGAIFAPLKKSMPVNNSVPEKSPEVQSSVSEVQFPVPRGAVDCTRSEEIRRDPNKKTGAGAPGAVDKSEEAGERHGDLGESHKLLLAGSTPAPASKSHRCKPGGKLCAALRAPADQLFNSDPQRFRNLIKWIWLQLSRDHEELDIIAALVALQGREESYGLVEDWWAYLEGANGTGQSMIERVRSRRLQGEAAEYKKPGPIKLGDLADLARLAAAGK